MKILTPPTNMPTFAVNIMQLVCGAMIAVSVGGLATYAVLTNIAMECRVERPDLAPQNDAAKRFMSPDLVPMDQGKRF
jgi:hypothetical protein